MVSITDTILVISLLIVGILCSNNVTDKYNTMDAKDFQSRNNRLLTFDTQENGDISMELAFNVPFITIPVKKSVDMAQGAIANLNVGAVVLAGAIAFGFAILIPGVILFMSKKVFNYSTPPMGYRNDDPQNLWSYLNLLDQMLTEHNMDTTSCLQRMICWSVKNSAENVDAGQSSSTDKIIDGLASSLWLQQLVEGTVIHSAIKAGLNHVNCTNEYNQCQISQSSIQTLAKTLLESINSRK